MSQSITLATPASISLSTLTSGIPENLAIKKVFDGEVLLGDVASYVRVYAAPNVKATADEYRENDDLDVAFRQSLSDKIFYRVSFNDVALLRASLAKMFQGIGPLIADCWIDTDYGWVMSGTAFAARLKDPSWDWRRPAQ